MTIVFVLNWSLETYKKFKFTTGEILQEVTKHFFHIKLKNMNIAYAQVNYI